jgi:plastocyanin
MQHIVSIQDFFFNPADLTISAGDSVVWENQGSVTHTASRDDAPAFDTGKISPGSSSAPSQFNAASGDALKYFCRPHKAMMKGTITVT